MSTPGSDFHKMMERTWFTNAALHYPGVKTYTPNAKWKEPTNEFYFAFYIEAGDTFRVSISENRRIERTVLRIHISVYSPVETNERVSLEMAETASRWFSNQDFKVGPGHSANFQAGTVKTSPDPKTGKFRVIATVRGHRDVEIVRP